MRWLLELYENGKKVAEQDITTWTVTEIELLMEIQHDMERTWRIKQFKREIKL